MTQNFRMPALWIPQYNCSQTKDKIRGLTGEFGSILKEVVMVEWRI
jgi:hypothetical protein